MQAATRKAQTVLKKNRSLPRTSKCVNVLRGFIKCSLCGSIFIASPSYHSGKVRTRGHTADIPHSLFHFCEYSAVKSFIRYSKEFESLLMLLGQIQYYRPLPRDEAHMDSHKIVK